MKKSVKRGESATIGKGPRGVCVPTVGAAVDARSYLQALVEENGALDAKFSIRWFCQRLKWPASYINDVLAGRRALSLNRALELARFLKLDSLDTEHLVVLVLAGSGEAPVAQHFARERRLRFQHPSSEPSEALGVFDELEHMLVFVLLAAAGRRLAPSEIRARLYTLSERSDAEVESILAEFAKTGHFEEAPNGDLRFLKRTLDYNLDGAGPERRVAVFKEHLLSAIRYLESPQRASPGSFTSRVMSLTAERAREVAARLDQFQSWLSATTADQEAAAPAADSPETRREVFQYVGAVFPLSR